MTQIVNQKTELGLKEAPKTNGTEKPRTKAMAAAPVSRDGGAVTSGKLSPNLVTLTPGEVSAATDGVTLTWNYDDPKGKFKRGDAIGVHEMAKRKQAMQKEGRYDRSFTES